MRYFDEYRDVYDYEEDWYDDLDYDYYDNYPDPYNPAFDGYTEYNEEYTADKLYEIDQNLLATEDRFLNYEAGLLHPEVV